MITISLWFSIFCREFAWELLLFKLPNTPLEIIITRKERWAIVEVIVKANYTVTEEYCECGCYDYCPCDTDTCLCDNNTQDWCNKY